MGNGYNSLDELSLLEDHYAKNRNSIDLDKVLGKKRGVHRLGGSHDEIDYDVFIVVRCTGMNSNINGVYTELDKAVASLEDNYEWIVPMKLNTPTSSSLVAGGWVPTKFGDKV